MPIAIRCCIVWLVILSRGLVGGEHPNIVLIYTDDQGYGDASCLNPESKFSTPNIDRLAREGIVFTDGHCSDTVCTPSRYGLLTGRYSWRTELKRGVFHAERKCLISDDRLTLPLLLKQFGYQTGMVGKWHLGMDFPGERTSRDWSQPVLDMPLDKGFDYFWGIPASMNYGVLAWFDGRFAPVPPTLYTQKKPNQRALADYRIMPPYDSRAKVQDTDQTGRVAGKLEVAADFVDNQCLERFTSRAVDWIRERDPSKPFFLYLPYTSPHKPVVPNPAFQGQGQAGAYGEFMIETDWHVGRILEFLDQAGLAENTLVIFTSDNGPETTWKQRAERYQHQSNFVFREGKRSLYEGGHRVPFIVRWPAGIVAPGRQHAQPVCQTDCLATIAEILGASLPAEAGEDSLSFYAALKNTPAEPRPAMVHHGSQGGFAIRHRNWKLVLGSHARPVQELYDLAMDPGESTNVLDAHPEVAQRLQAELTRIVVSGRSNAGPDGRNDTGYWDDLHWITPEQYDR